jgi:hypothetical protein
MIQKERRQIVSHNVCLFNEFQILIREPDALFANIQCKILYRKVLETIHNIKSLKNRLKSINLLTTFSRTGVKSKLLV